jgi:hypothetical protein
VEEMVGPVSTCRREVLQGWCWSIGLTVSFMIFIASVRNILDNTTYISCSYQGTPKPKNLQTPLQLSRHSIRKFFWHVNTKDSCILWDENVNISSQQGCTCGMSSL